MYVYNYYKNLEMNNNKFRDIIEVTHEGREYGMPVRPVRMNK